MRSDRRREIEEQLEAEKGSKKKPKRNNGLFRVLAVIYTLLATGFVVLLWKMDVIPGEYFYPGLGILLLISLFIVPVMYSRKARKGRRIGATVIALLLMGIFSIGIWYLNDTMSFLGHITKINGNVKEVYSVVVKEDSGYKSIEELKNQTLGTYLIEDFEYSEAKATLKKKINAAYVYDETVEILFSKLQNNEHEAIFISKGTYDSYVKDGSEMVAGTKILYNVEIEVEPKDHTNSVNVKKEPFNVYISGIDIKGDIKNVSRSDVNMVATVNPITHKVLLTSIPRDYYITLPSKAAKDKLTHSGLYGVQETIGAVEDIMKIDINYYVRVNYSTVIDLVDAIGGIEVDSPNDFTTSGMQNLNGHHFIKGINKLDGKAALAFSRERHSFLAGDMERNQNQQLVLKAILEKATSSATVLKSYPSILKAMDGKMETNMTQAEMTTIVKEQLRDMPSWKIDKQAIKGVSGYDHCFALGMKASIITQDPEENAKAMDEIVRIMTEKEK